MPGKNAVMPKRKVACESTATNTLKDHLTASVAPKRSRRKQPEDDDEIVEKATAALLTATTITNNTAQDENIATKPKKTKKTSTKKKKKDKDDQSNDCDDDDDGDGDGEADKEESKVTKEPRYKRQDFCRPSDGKEWNLKIVSFNVNGIRAWLQKDGLDYLKAEDPDVFCMQELKCDKSKIPTEMAVDGYHCYWLSADTQGYSGVGLMSKQKPISVTFGINEKKHDDEGRVITAEYDKFYLINSYIPNSGRELVRLGYRMEWEKAFRAYLNEMNKTKPVVWCGDLNVAHNEIDLKNPKTSRKSAGFTQEERDCFTALLGDGYVDSFRHLYPTLTDQYTYWSYMRNAREKNVGWRVDYFVLAKALVPNLVDSAIRPKVVGSDHCPIALFLKI